MFIPGRPFQPSLMLVSKVRSLPYSGASERFFTQVGSGPTHKHLARLERLSSDKRSCFLQTFENYRRKKFYNLDSRSSPSQTSSTKTWCQFHQTFFVNDRGSKHDKFYPWAGFKLLQYFQAYMGISVACTIKIF